jgi:hypothetical protein
MYSLREAGAEEQFIALADRIAHVPFPDPPLPGTLPGSHGYFQGMLLDTLRRAGTHQQAAGEPTVCQEQACSNSSASNRAARIGSGSAGVLTAARPRRGAGRGRWRQRGGRRLQGGSTKSA